MQLLRRMNQVYIFQKFLKRTIKEEAQVQKSVYNRTPSNDQTNYLSTYLPITFAGGPRKHYRIDSLLLRLLWFLRACKTPEPGRCTWEDNCIDLIVMCFTYLKRTLQSPLIGVLGNNIELEIVNILKLKQHCLRYERRQRRTMWFELLTIQSMMIKPHIFQGKSMSASPWLSVI